MPLLIWMVADAWVHSDRLEALRGELHAPRAETAAEASAADAAERLADIAVKPGLWIYKKEVRSVSVRFDLLLREDRTFVATVRGEIEDKEKLTASASGEWRVKGHVLVLQS
ncbi:MAG TPA: hypothetical protein PKY50_20065 [Candidatus Competibacter sp.]|nr:hypothetical protein [Candidatus Competibacter sp.]